MPEAIRTVAEVQTDLNQKREALAELFDKHVVVDGDEKRYNFTDEQLDDVRSRNDELNDLFDELKKSEEVDDIYQNTMREIKNGQRTMVDLQRGGGMAQAVEAAKSLGEMFVDSKFYKERDRGRDIKADFPDYEYKTTMTTAAGFAPESTRTGKVVDYAHRRPVVADLIPQTQTEQAAVVYMEETTFTNNADTASEGAAAVESALAYTERSETVREIKTFLPVTEIQLEDASMVRSLIDNRLMTMLDLAEETQLLSGNGSAPDMTGFLVKSGVQSQAKGTDPVPDAIYKGMTKVRSTGFAEPSGVIMHPNDWLDVRLLRTADGIYIWGSPADAGPGRIWGAPVIPTTAQTENTALLGDFALYSELFNRLGAEIKVSDSHSDFFIKGILAIRARKRAVLAIYRAAAFCKVTGI